MRKGGLVELEVRGGTSTSKYSASATSSLQFDDANSSSTFPSTNNTLPYSEYHDIIPEKVNMRS